VGAEQPEWVGHVAATTTGGQYGARAAE
jgi:hypothetical protein